jgi:hypothetical protein
MAAIDSMRPEGIACRIGAAASAWRDKSPTSR